MTRELARAIAAWLVLATVAVLLAVAGSCSASDPYRKLNVGHYECTQARAGDPWTC